LLAFSVGVELGSQSIQERGLLFIFLLVAQDSLDLGSLQRCIAGFLKRKTRVLIEGGVLDVSLESLSLDVFESLAHLAIGNDLVFEHFLILLLLEKVTGLQSSGGSHVGYVHEVLPVLSFDSPELLLSGHCIQTMVSLSERTYLCALGLEVGIGESRGIKIGEGRLIIER
jgi:hypothetical protein